MISITLLLKMIVIGLFAVGWAHLYRSVRRTERRLEYLRKHCDEQLDALAETLEQFVEQDAPEPDAAETRRKAIEAERRFTEGIANILNFGYLVSGETPAGKKGD